MPQVWHRPYGICLNCVLGLAGTQDVLCTPKTSDQFSKSQSRSRRSDSQRLCILATRTHGQSGQKRHSMPKKFVWTQVGSLQSQDEVSFGQLKTDVKAWAFGQDPSFFARSLREQNKVGGHSAYFSQRICCTHGSAQHGNGAKGKKRKKAIPRCCSKSVQVVEATPK